MDGATGGEAATSSGGSEVTRGDTADAVTEEGRFVKTQVKLPRGVETTPTRAARVEGRDWPRKRLAAAGDKSETMGEEPRGEGNIGGGRNVSEGV